MPRRKGTSRNRKRQEPTITVEVAERIRDATLERLSRPARLQAQRKEFEEVVKRLTAIHDGLVSKYATKEERTLYADLCKSRRGCPEEERATLHEETIILYRTFGLREQVEAARANNDAEHVLELENAHYEWVAYMRLTRAALNVRGWRSAGIAVDQRVIHLTFFVPSFDVLRPKWPAFLKDLKRRFGGEVPPIKYSTAYPLIDPTGGDDELGYKIYDLRI